MDEQQRRLANCFWAVFPELSSEEIIQASSTTVEGWNSVAVVTLLSVIEEEFGISITEDDVAQFDSFERILNYLQETARPRQSPNDVG
jgi:acyl carrier protein